jgi:hypothetical protein
MSRWARYRGFCYGIWLAVGVFLAISIPFSVFSTLATADESAWALEVLDPGPAGYPAILADSQGREHAVWAHFFRETGDETDAAILYTRRDSGGIWTAPVDVLVPGGEGIIADLAGTMDPQDWIHLIWRGSDGLYYSSVHAPEADQARAWSKPRVISRGGVGTSSITSGPDGIVHIVYPDVSTSPGTVLYIKSTDGGATWTDPQPVSEPRHSDVQPATANMAVAGSGRLHVVWTETINEFPPSGVFYTHSDDHGKSWYEPRMMAGRGHKWISVGLEAGDERVHLIWTGTGDVRGKYHAVSRDGGVTWAETEVLFPGGAGYLGFSRFAVDSGGSIHLVTAMGRSTAQIAGGWTDSTWHSPGEIFSSTWEDGQWSRPEHVSTTIWDPQLERNFPSITISEGNLLSIVWGTYDLEGERRPIWHASRRLESPLIVSTTAEPAAPPRQSPTVLPSTLATSPATRPASSSASPTHLPVGVPPTEGQTLWPMLSAILAALLVVSCAVSWKLLRK